MKNKSLIFFFVLLAALICFEIFNFDAARTGLRYFMGTRTFMGIEWVMWLAMAACAADMIGMIRIFTEETNFKKESTFVIAATGVWILAATINSVLTWWTTTLIVLDANVGNQVLSQETLIKAFPLLVAIFIWLLRIGLVATLASLGDKALHSIKLPAKKPSIAPTTGYRPMPTSGMPIRTSAMPLRTAGAPTKTFSVMDIDADK
jgi:hypothetical protein